MVSGMVDSYTHLGINSAPEDRVAIQTNWTCSPLVVDDLTIRNETNPPMVSIIMGFTGGANIEGTKGNHNMLSPAYNVTKEEVEKIVDVFVKSIEEVLAANGL